MAPKKKLTPDQQASYEGVLAKLQADGLLTRATPEEKAPARKRKPAVEEPLEKKAAKPKGRATKDADTGEDLAPKRKPTKPKALAEKPPANASHPTTAKATTKANPGTEAKTRSKQGHKAAADPASADPTSGKKSKKGQCESTTDSTREPSVAASLAGSNQSSNELPMIYDDDLEMYISWDTFDVVLAEVLKRYPDEGAASVEREMEKALGPCPPNMGPRKLLAAEETHPGPVMEDDSLKKSLGCVGNSSAVKKKVKDTQGEEETQALDSGGEDPEEDLAQEGEEEEEGEEDEEMEEDEGDVKPKEERKEATSNKKQKVEEPPKNPAVSA